jgi:sulfatase modifying factor 1
VPEGVYLLGSNISDSGALAHEMPEHKASLNGFNIYTHEVTNEMYQACVNSGVCLPVSTFRSENPDYFTKNEFAKYPVIGVDWYMAKSYCEWAGGRLPTEAEWEAASRGDDERIYPWGNTNADCTNSALLGCSKEDIGFQVGSFPLGNSLFKGWDMAGNVWEWVNDWYDANTYATIPASNPYGPWDGDFKVIRGGGWNSPANNVRSANRQGIDPSLAYKDLGFRCVANGFTTPISIRIPEESHSRGEGSERSVEDTSRTSDHPGDAIRNWSWGRLQLDCGSGGISLFSMHVRNNFGGVYSSTVDGAPASCAYNAASGWLSCSFASATARSGSAGSEFYQFEISLQDPSGSPITGAVYSIGVGGNAYSTCTADGASYAHTSAFCGTDNLPYLRVEPTTPTIFSEVFIDNGSNSYTYSDPTRECVVGGSGAVCPLFSSVSSTMMGTMINGSVRGTMLDGITSLHAVFSSINVPTCGSGASSESPRVSAETFCSATGISDFRIINEPAGSLLLTGIGDAGGGHFSCVWREGVGFECSTPPAGSDGKVRINLRGFRTTHPGEDYPLPQLVFTPASCPGSFPGDSSLTFDNLVCRPDGLPGVIAPVYYSGSARTVSMQTTFRGTASPCETSTVSPHSFYCSLPVPLPTDLQFCSSIEGSPYTCTGSPYSSAHLPARCGGSSSSETWTTSAGCMAEGASGFDFEIGVTSGRNVASISAILDGGSTPCSSNPRLSNTFTCPLSLAYLGRMPTFHTDFVDGTSIDYVVENFNTFIPSHCPGSDTPTTPGGSTCADNRSSDSWHNPSTGEDVNNDGCVTPSDTLSLITRINGVGPGTLTNPRPTGAPFWDVNGDGSITAIDVLMTINSINSHTGQVCTPTCRPTTSGDWRLEAVCNPISAPAGWMEFRAHFPGVRTNVNGFGRSYGGCTFGGDPTNGQISQFCSPGIDFSSPMQFWVSRSDGSIDQHTFTGVADLAVTCPAAGVNFNATATCNTETVGTYNLDFNWTPADYSVYAIYDSAGTVISNCSICSGGTCQCTGITPGSDGQIHLLMDHREGTTEVQTPLTVVPPSCNAGLNSGWGLSAECATGPSWAGLNVASVRISSPPILALTAANISLLTPGYLSCRDAGTSSVLLCFYDLFLTPRESLDLNFYSPAPGNPRGSHSFSNFDTVLPLNCLVPTENSPEMNSFRIRCVGNRPFVTVTDTSLLSINSILFNSIHPSPGDCVNLGTAEVSCFVPYGLAGTNVDIGVIGPDRLGVERNHPWLDEYILVCGVTPTPSVYTPTPTARPLTCADYTNSNTCNSNGCNWWYSDSTCRVDPEPHACSYYNGDAKSCNDRGGCYYWTNKTCNEKQESCEVQSTEFDCHAFSSICKWAGYCYTP